MADTRRLRKGYESVGMAMSSEDAMRLRLGATASRMSLGDYVASLLPADPIVPLQPRSPMALARLARKAGKAPRQPQEPSQGGGDSMSWGELVAALQRAGRSHRDLRDWLGLSNISIWAQDGVPAKHLARIREFLAQEQER